MAVNEAGPGEASEPSGSIPAKPEKGYFRICLILTSSIGILKLYSFVLQRNHHSI